MFALVSQHLLCFHLRIHRFGVSELLSSLSVNDASGALIRIELMLYYLKVIQVATYHIHTH